jgi:hypothetical protein
MAKRKKIRSLRERLAGSKIEVEGRRKLRDQLALPVLNPRLVQRLGGAQRTRSLDALEQEVLVFNGVDDAMKRSHRYYRRALAKVYEVWLELLTWPESDRFELLQRLNDATEQKTKKGDGLHVLLRALIDYGGSSDESLAKEDLRKVNQAAVRRVGRDAAALRCAARSGVAAGGFAEFVDSYPGGLVRMERDEAQARKADGGRPATARRPRLKLLWPDGLEDAVLDTLDESEGVALFLTPGEDAGTFKVAVAHNVNRDVENWCGRFPALEPIEPAQV